MELRQLEMFIAFAEEGTVTAAAGRMRLAQPAMSRQLASLERSLRVRLFDRSGNRMRLSQAGRRLVPVVRELLAEAQHAEAAAEALAQGRVDVLTIAAAEATLGTLVAPYLATLPTDGPLLLAREVPIDDVYGALETGADVAIAPASPERPLEALQLGVVPVRAYVPAAHSWAREDRRWISLAELVREPLLVLPRPNFSRLEFDAAVATHGLNPEKLIECEVGRAIQAHAAAGRGVGLVTDLPRFGTHDVLVSDDGTADGELLGLTLYAAWSRQHFAASTIAGVAHGLAEFFRVSGLTRS